MLVVFATTSTFSPYANILLMTILATLLLLYSALVGLLYKNWLVSFLEMLYLVNLIIMGEAILFFPQNNVTEWRLNFIPAFSLCFALFQFICILVFHVVKRLMTIKKVFFRRNPDHTNIATNKPAVHMKQYSNSFSLRESLLSDI